MASSVMFLQLVFVLGFITFASSQQRFRVRPSNASVIAGDNAILRCEVELQVGQIQWAKDGFALGYSRSLPGYDKYRMIGDPVTGHHDLEITNVSMSDQGRFQCQVSPKHGHKAIKADAFLTVYVRPKSVRLTSLTSEGVENVDDIISLKEGDQMVLQCDVAGGTPAAEIVWLKNDVIFAPDSEDIQFRPKDTGSNDSHSSIDIEATRGDDGTVYSCMALHPSLSPGDQTKFSDSISLKVMYPPGPPEVINPDPSIPIRAGERTTLTCRSRGGNPPAELVWFRDQQVLPHQYSTSTEGAEARVFFTASAEDMKALYRCQASSAVQPQPTETTYRPNVLFGPEQVAISGPSTGRRGDNVQLVCNITGSNPAPVVLWSMNNQDITTTDSQKYFKVNDTYIFSTSTRIPDDSPGDVTIACRAQNPETETSQISATQIELIYAPEFDSAVYEESTMLGGELIVNLSARARPADIVYRWQKDAPVRPPRTNPIANGRVLRMNNVTKDDGGWYSLTATNVEGSTAVKVHLDVLYPPIVRLDSMHTGLEGSDVSLKCWVDASPLEQSMVEWMKGNSKAEGDKFKTSFVNNTSVLTLRNISRTDIDEYTCIVNNGLGSTRRTTTLLVKHAPKLSGTPEHLKAAASVGGAGRLVCRAFGVPELEFQWFKDGKLINNGGRFSIANRQIDPVTWESSLHVSDVRSKDFGSYDCTVRNELGSRHQTVILQSLSVPDPPLSVNIANVSSDAISLSWTAGFSGGQPQTFKVRYLAENEAKGPHHQDIDVQSRTFFTLHDLMPNTQYNISVASSNQMGSRGFSEFILATTLETAVDSGMLVVQGSQIPWLLVTLVSVVGVLLLVMNIVLVAFLVRRKRRSKRHSASPSEASTKSETVQTYVNETTSSVSLKSSESFPADDIPDHFRVEITRDGLNMYANDSNPRRPSQCGSENDGYVNAIRRNSYAYTTASFAESGRASCKRDPGLRPPRAPYFADAPRQEIITPDLLHSNSSVSGDIPAYSNHSTTDPFSRSQSSIADAYPPVSGHYPSSGVPPSEMGYYPNHHQASMAADFASLPQYHASPVGTLPRMSQGLCSLPPPRMDDEDFEHQGHLV